MCVKWDPKPSGPVFRNWQRQLLHQFKVLSQNNIWGPGPEWLTGASCSCCSAAKPMSSLESLSSTLSTPNVAILDPARGKKRNTGTKRENRRKQWGRVRGGATSCLWPERREGPRDMTDYRWGQRSRPMPRPQLSVMGQEGGCGAPTGAANKKGRSGWKNVKKKENVGWGRGFESIKMPWFVFLFFQMLAIITPQESHTSEI